MVSKPSIANKAEAQAETRQSLLIQDKLKQVNINLASQPEKDSKDANIEELNQKLIQTKKDLNDLKMSYTMKCKELEQAMKEVAELKETLSQKNAYSSKDSQEVKKLMEENQKLRSLNKHRDEILIQMESQNKSLRDTETQLKVTQNDYELLQSTNRNLEQRNKELAEKLELLDTKLNQFKEKAFQIEKEKEQVTIEYQNKIELLSYKLLNKAENDSSALGDDSKNGSGQFRELLGLCKSDLDEILNRLRAQFQNEGIEDQLRKELLEQSRKTNELKSEHERQIYQLSNENFQKIDKL